MKALTTVYSGRSTSWPMFWLTTAAAAPLLAIGLLSGGPVTAGLALTLAFLLAMLVVNTLTATSVRASAGPSGVIVRFGVLGWPRFAYALDRIEHAEVTRISRWSVLAWGISWLPGSGLRLAMGPGPALLLTLTNGRKVTVSMPDPDAAVATLEAARAVR